MATISQNICRICEKNSNKLIDVSAPQFQSLIGKYLSLANVKFDVNDELPKYFCEICIDFVNISHDFKEQCERTYNKLLQMLQTIEIKEESVDAEDNDFYQNIFDLEALKDELTINDNKVKELHPPPTNVTSLKTYKCYICNNFAYKTKRTLSKHMRLKHKMKNVNNDLSLTTSNTIKNEITNKLEKIPQSKSKSKRKKEISLKTYECYICRNFSFKTRNTLFKHMQVKHDFGWDGTEKKNYKCDLCNYQTTVSIYLTKHRKRHFVDKSLMPKFTCEICGSIFSFIANMRRHIIDVHQKKKRFECNMCEVKYSRLSNLKLHLATHSDERNFKCEQCEKTFKSKNYLKCHLLVHLPSDQMVKIMKKKKMKNYQKQIICEICGKSMASTCIYPHMRKHNGTHLIYECKICPKKFVSNQQLSHHTYTHTGERPSKCKLCPKTFRQPSHLSEHMKTHTNIRPHKCRFCEKAFKQASNLREHERIHTGETPYSCNLCLDRFKNTRLLQMHAKNMHPENEEASITAHKRGELLKQSFVANF